MKCPLAVVTARAAAVRFAAACVLVAGLASLCVPAAGAQQRAPADSARADSIPSGGAAHSDAAHTDTGFVERRAKKSPLLAGALSGLFLVGAGQMYNGEPGKAFLAIGGVTAGGLLAAASLTSAEDTAGREWVGGTGVLLMAGSYFFSVIDAVLSAQCINDEIEARRARTAAERRVRIAPVYAGDRPGVQLTIPL